MRSLFIWIARVFFSLLFIYSGAVKLMNWQGSVDGLILTFSEWKIHLDGNLVKESIYEILQTNAHLIMGVAIAFELIGAFLILFGFKIRIGAAILLLFLIPVTVIMHPFWFNVGPEEAEQLSIFLKNLSLIGALLYIALTPKIKRVVA